MTGTATSLTSDYGPDLARAAILVLDDEPGMRNFLTKILGPRVRYVAQAGSAEEASRLLDGAHFDVVILDNVMPRQTGLEWLAQQRKRGLAADIILITAYADLETAITALRTGVSDFVLKPFRADQILAAVARTLDRTHLRRDNTLLRHELAHKAAQAPLVGRSPALSAVREMLTRLSGLPTPVLFTGDSGTGKEVAARTLHALSTRAEQPFVPVNCAAIPPDRAAEDLFGVMEDGDNLRRGLFLLADGGTLFLDEIVQMPLPLQATLLRVLEDQRVRPVGGARDMPLNLRLLFATNSDLPNAVEEGRFRADLYHRINVVNVHMPPLRDRTEDIVELTALFMQQFTSALSMPGLVLDDETLLRLTRYDWPGNVRELRNLVERSVILGAFPPEFAGDGRVTGGAALETLELVEQRHILRVLDSCGGNRAEAARRLGVSRKTIDRKCALWEVDGA